MATALKGTPLENVRNKLEELLSKSIADAAARAKAVDGVFNPLLDLLEREPSLGEKISVDTAVELTAMHHYDLKNNRSSSPKDFERHVREAARKPLRSSEVPLLTSTQVEQAEARIAAAGAGPAKAAAGKFGAAVSEVGRLILKHPEKAAGIAGLLTLMTAYLLPSKQEQKKNSDGSVEVSAKWGPVKVTAVALGTIVSGALLAYFAHGKLANKVGAEAAAVLGR